MGVTCLEFRGENFRGWRKFVKVFSLESFPLYGSRYDDLYRIGDTKITFCTMKVAGRGEILIHENFHIHIILSYWNIVSSRNSYVA